MVGGEGETAWESCRLGGVGSPMSGDEGEESKPAVGGERTAGGCRGRGEAVGGGEEDEQ